MSICIESEAWDDFSRCSISASIGLFGYALARTVNNFQLDTNSTALLLVIPRQTIFVSCISLLTFWISFTLSKPNSQSLLVAWATRRQKQHWGYPSCCHVTRYCTWRINRWRGCEVQGERERFMCLHKDAVLSHTKKSIPHKDVHVDCCHGERSLAARAT